MPGSRSVVVAVQKVRSEITVTEITDFESDSEMEFNFGLLFLLALITQGYTIQVPLTEASQQFFSSSKSSYSAGVLISGNTDK